MLPGREHAVFLTTTMPANPTQKRCKLAAARFRQVYAKAKIKLDVIFWFLVAAAVGLIGAAVLYKDPLISIPLAAVAVIFIGFAMKVASVLGECELQYLHVEHALDDGNLAQANHAISQIVCFSALKGIIKDVIKLIPTITPAAKPDAG